MSFRSFTSSPPNIFSKNIATRYTAPVPLPRTINTSTTWTRNPAWLDFTIPSGSQEKFIGLYAVYPNYNSNFLAISGGTGNYTIDWGDGTVENINYTPGINKTGIHIYDYYSTGLNNSDIPITFDATTDIVNLSNHKYISGSIITFTTISGANGVAASQPYSVINTTTNTFQLSDIASGNLIDITSNGSGVILPYKQAIVTLTPQAGNNLTSLNLHLKYPSGDIPRYYSVPWLDMAISGPLMTGLKIATNTPFNTSDNYINMGSLERILITEANNIVFGALCCNLYGLKAFKYLGSGKMSSLVGLFQICPSLIDVEIKNTSDCTDFSNIFNGDLSLSAAPNLDLQNARTTNQMFNNCSALKSVPNYLTTGVQDFTSMFGTCLSLIDAPQLDYRSANSLASLFNNCGSLQTVFPINTVTGTNVTSIFANCVSLLKAPYIKTTNATNFGAMFQGCTSLEIVPSYDGSNNTSTSNMYNGCINLESVPFMITTGVTDMSSMFLTCYSLKNVPFFDTRNVTSMSSMFNGCYALQRVPLFNTSKVTNFTSMFFVNYQLKESPFFDTSLATNMSNMFRGCRNLQTIPKFETSGVTTTSSMFQECYGLKYIPQLNTKSVTNASYMFYACRSLVAATGLNFTNNTDFTSLFEGCYALENVSLASNNATATSFANIFYQNKALKTINMAIPNATNLSLAFYDCNSLTTIPKITSTNINNITNAFVNNYALNSIPNIVLSGITSAGNFTTPFTNCYSLARIDASGYRVSFSVAGTTLSAVALNQLFSGLYPGAAQTVTITSSLGAAFCDRSIASGKSWVVIG